MAIFEGACVLIIALALYAMTRQRRLASLLPDYAVLAVSAWLGEQSCIVLYRFYHYAPTWHGRLGEVPILVPLIWPLVVLSGEQVARELWPKLSAVKSAAAVAAIVALDASLVEVVAVRAGLWQWSEAGHLGVPLIGILGWAYFALGAAWGLARLSGWQRGLIVLLGPLCAHGLILLSWWGLFRWTLRGELGVGALLGVSGVGVFALLGALWMRRRGRAISLAAALPRMVAASLFFLLLCAHDPTSGPLWLHTAAVALPYCAATRWQLTLPANQRR